MEARFIYITCKDKTEALSIGRLLLVENLIACANVMDGMTSVYRWEGRVVEDNETVLIAKSVASKVPELIEKVKSAHSYSTPCVVSLPIKEGNPDYIGWIGDELQIESK